jgi:hypothetical protein
MSPCTHDVYRHFYSLKYITSKEMANLISGNDPREGSLSFKNSKFANVYQQIRDAVARSDVKFDGQLTVESEIDSKVFFEWAIKECPGFREKVPAEMITICGEINIVEPNQHDEFFAVFIPQTYEELKKLFIKNIKEHKEDKKILKRK